MPTYDKRARYPSNMSRVAIPTLSGGVGRQAPTKRGINEAENLDNMLVTLERSVEKRPGTNAIRRFTDKDFTTLEASSPTDSSLDLNDKTAAADYKFFWFQIAEEQRYLIAVNFKSAAVIGSPTNDEKDQYIQIFRTSKDGFLECGLANHNTVDLFNYFTYKHGDTSMKADDSLSSITVGPQLLINNSNVYAGYTSKEHTFLADDLLGGAATDTGLKKWCTIGLDGEFVIGGTAPANDYTEDIKGRKLVYYSTTPVDTEGQASIYVDGKFYIKNDQVFVSVPSGTDLAPYLLRQVKGTGSLKFGTQVSTSYTANEEDLPTSLTDYNIKTVLVANAAGATDAKVRFTFSTENERDAFAGTASADGITRFVLGDENLPMTNTTHPGIGGSDYISVSTGGAGLFYLDWISKAVTGTPTTDPVRLVTEAVAAAHTAAGAVPFTVPYDYVGTINPDGSTLPAGISDYVADYAAGTLTTNSTYGDPLVLVFNCLRDGATNGSLPSTAVDAATTEAYFTLRSDDDGGPIAKYIPVEDWQYPDSTRRHLGNQLADFSEFNFPPKANEATLQSDGESDEADIARFNLPAVYMEDKVSASLFALYPDLAQSGDGKIYYVSNSYAGEVPGYYLVKDVTNSPYTRLIRSPEEFSVLDENRFPKIIKIASFNASGIEQFTIENLDLEERRSGNLKTNTGPEAFKDGKQSQIKSMAFFRDRLFLSAGDTVFSSRTGDFSDFWVENPSVVSDTDPIDARLSTNKYAEVESMTPFASSLFINTGSDIQFTLKGSENNITPFTAEVSPTAFYSTSSLVNPVLLGSQIYFFAPKRAYVYFNDSTVTVNQAIEVSLTCPNYLPSTFGDIAVVPGYDSLCMIDKDNKKFLYVYTNRYRGADVVQNAFYRYIYDHDVMAVNSYDNDIFLVQRQLKDPAAGAALPYRYHLVYQKFFESDSAVPRLDHQLSFTEDEGAAFGSIAYTAGTNRTVLKFEKYGNINPDTLYIAPGGADEERGGEVIQLYAGRDADVVDDVDVTDGTLTITLVGDFTSGGTFREFVAGTSYSSTVQLSPQYTRDENNNAIEGTFSLRTLHLRHHNTGSYRVEKKIRGRRERAHIFTPAELDESQVKDFNDLPTPLYEKNGETFTKIMGFAAETDIYIVSDYPNPLNISQIELKGRFTNRTSGFVR